MSSTPFGEHLKREREMRGVSLDEIAAATRINTRFLEALENGRWDQLPGGAFNRGFIRSTSRFLGLDEDSMVAEYALETDSTSPVRSTAQRTGTMPRDWRPAVAAISIAVVLIVGIAWLAYHEMSVHRRRRAVIAAAPLANSPANSAAPAAGSPMTPDVTNRNSAATTMGRMAPGSQESTSTAADTLKLRMEAAKPVSVRVTADGKAVFKSRMHASDIKTFEAHDSFEVTANDSSALEVQLNGQPVQLVGSPRHRTKLTLTRKDLKPAAGALH
ncbi:MAG: helix-turn-helix domain-containing protein [Candidatus Acidiferrales bacterium]